MCVWALENSSIVQISQIFVHFHIACGMWCGGTGDVSHLVGNGVLQFTKRREEPGAVRLLLAVLQADAELDREPVQLENWMCANGGAL